MKLYRPPIHGRRKPYTERGITRVECYRCRRRSATEQWNICALGGRYVPLCEQCGTALNVLVLRWARVPDREALMEQYRQHVEELMQ